MTRFLSYATFCMVAVALVGCSGSGEGAPGRTEYRTTLGTTTPNNIITYSDETLLTNYGYRYQRREVQSFDNIYMETEWKDLTPTEDEQALGIQRVRARILITAKIRNRSTGDVSGRFTGEIQYRMTGEASWVQAPMTPQRQTYIKDIADYLKTELRSNWRQ